MARLYQDEALYNQTRKNKCCDSGRKEKFVRAAELKRILADPKRLELLASDLMENAGICTKQQYYGIEHLSTIQQYYDSTYGAALYRLVCIGKDEQNGPVVLWKGPIGREFELSLLLEDGHFRVLKKISRYFKVK